MKKAFRIVFSLFATVLCININAQDYTLVWEDNFDGTTLDSSKWNVERKVGIWNTGANSEFQHYRKENVTVGDDGNGNNCLILTAKKENHNDYSYTSGKVTTKGKFAFRRGKLEASIKIPDLANGLWPAFWTLGNVDKGWPDCGEIDVLEMGHAKGILEGVQNHFIGAHLFWGPYPADYGTEFEATEDLSTGYFKHTLIWDESTIKVYFNDAADPYFSMGISGDGTEEYRDYLHYIILNLAVGGSVPGIYNPDEITATFPANMYVDWVKLYQETDKKDIGEDDLAQFGIFGVYEDLANTDVSMDLGFDLFENTSGLTAKTDETPYEGENVLSYNTSASQAYEIKLTAGLKRNMTEYAEGSVQFYIKSEITDDIQLGIADHSGNEAFITLNASSEIDFDRNGTWQLVYIPIAELSATVNISELKDMLTIKGNSSSASYISIDQVICKENIPAKGYYAINCDNPNITEGFVVDNVSNNLYIWNNTIVFDEYYPAFEGENTMSFKATGAEAWCGFGYHSNTPINLENYVNGYLNLSLRTRTTVDFYIGMDGDGHGGVIDFVSGSDPYEFERNGEWHHINIPMSDLVTKGLNLASVSHIFKTGSGGKITNIAVDNVFLSEELPNIENPMICYANKVTITPASKTINVDQKTMLSATVLNQFGKKFDEDLTWTTDGGEITETGRFSSSETGVFTVTARQGNTAGTSTITVKNPNAINYNMHDEIQSYFVASENNIVVKGLKKQTQISIVNIEGRQIIRKQINSNSTYINMANQANGVYIIKVESENNLHVNKFVKQ